MIRVELYTTGGVRDDGVLVTHIVTSGFIPPFKTYPDVIQWGTRVFKFIRRQENLDLLIYEECFAFYLINER